MSIPDYQSVMLPLLAFAGDRKEHSKRDATDHISALFKLTEEERKELLPSGRQYIIDNRVGWATTYLKKAGLLESPRRSVFRITDQGLEVLKRPPKEINVRFLEQFPGFVEFRKVGKGDLEEQPQERGASEQTPQEALEYGYQKMRKDLAQELLISVKQMSPQFFERLVVELLLGMGYGGTLSDAGKAIGQSGDGGIDGIIKEDKLGLDVIYIQAKRWEGTVGRPEIHKFVGALAGKRASKGVFITTSSFTKDAAEYVTTIADKIILIDGDMLAQLMIDHDIGVTRVASYDIKRIDSDYFSEE
jgi:restriction system protein